MREILFRGKSIIDNSWEYGLLDCSQYENQYYIGFTELLTPVKANTIGQFTCLLDKDGVKIFEGDILEYKNDYGLRRLHQVFHREGGFVINTFDEELVNNRRHIPLMYEACADSQTSQYIKQCKVIGNIHENPELLQKQ